MTGGDSAQQPGVMFSRQRLQQVPAAQFRRVEAAGVQPLGQRLRGLSA